MLSAESCQLLLDDHTICLLGMYHQLFHCEVSHHSTSVKVQYVVVVQYEGSRCNVTLGSPSRSGTVNTKAVILFLYYFIYTQLVYGS